MFQPMFSALGLLHGSWHQAPSHWMNVAEALYPHGCVPSSPWWCSYSLQIRHLSPCCCVHYLCKCIHIRITMQDTMLHKHYMYLFCTTPQQLITLRYANIFHYKSSKILNKRQTDGTEILFCNQSYVAWLKTCVLEKQQVTETLVFSSTITQLISCQDTWTVKASKTFWWHLDCMYNFKNKYTINCMRLMVLDLHLDVA